MTEKKDGDPLKVPTKICTNLFNWAGVVPDKDDFINKYKGYKFFCSKTDHTDPTNPKGNTIVPADGAAYLKVGAIGLVSAYLMA